MVGEENECRDKEGKLRTPKPVGRKEIESGSLLKEVALRGPCRAPMQFKFKEEAFTS